ncbi:MAG: hypothetical protein P8Y13_12810 [Deinococcales bacterium]
MNVLIFGGAMLLFWSGSKLLHHPRTVGATVPKPADMTVGQAPAALDSGDYRLQIDGARWVKQDALPSGVRLTYRARPNVLVDYVVVRVTVADRGASKLPLSYEGAVQDVRFLLASRDPESFYTEPVPPSDARLISGAAPLKSGALAAGEQRGGVLVYAVEPFRKAFSLLLIPVYGDTPPEQGPQHPAVELHFAPTG